MDQKPRDILIVTDRPLEEAEKTAARFERQGFQSRVYESLCERVRDGLVVLECSAIGAGKVMLFCRAN